MNWWRSFMIGVGALLVATAAVSPTPGAFGAGLRAPASTPLRTWMITRTAIGLIDSYMHGKGLAKSAFDSATTNELGGATTGWATRPTTIYTAYGTATSPGSFLYTVDHHSVPTGTTYVLYDDEDWAFTPHAEQVSPGAYMSAFVKLAHEHGYKAVLAPSIDLARAMPCHNPSDSPWVNYVTDCNLPQLAAKAGPDVYEVQAQMYESDTPLGVECGCYEWLVTQSAAEARLAAPTLDILAGLSTNQDGAVSTPQALYTDTENTQASTDGYWLNMPQQSAKCPACVPGGAPQVAVGYLEMLGYS